MTDHPIYHDIRPSHGWCGRCNTNTDETPDVEIVRCYTVGCTWFNIKVCPKHYHEHDHPAANNERGQSTAEMGLLAFLTAVLFFVGMQAIGQAAKIAFYATTPAYCDEYSKDKNNIIWHVLDCRTGLSIEPPVRIN